MTRSGRRQNSLENSAVNQYLIETGSPRFLGVRMNISQNKMVKIHYTLTDTDGKELDSSRNGDPIEYLHGNGNLISGLESELEGKTEGDKVHAVIQPKDAYGEYDEKLLIEVPRSQFDSDAKIEVGQQFQANATGDAMIVTVKKVTDDKITIDGNHELAGKTLCFDVDVIGVRDATEEEIAHANEGCGCGCEDCDGECDEEEGNCGNCNGSCGR
jgi:FKBP-type peptidyl-prolyl cis-trans isomerase SlyD